MLSGHTLTLTRSFSGSNPGSSGYALAADHAMLKTVPRRMPRAAVRASRGSRLCATPDAPMNRDRRGTTMNVANAIRAGLAAPAGRAGVA